MHFRNPRVPVLWVVTLVSLGTLGAAQERNERLSDSKVLYESAAYDAALAAFAKIDSAAIARPEQQELVSYQALCLLALGRNAEAEKTIETLIEADPLFRLQSSAPPRLATLVEGVRSRLLPTLARQHYVAGRTHFERRDFVKAIEEFTVVATLTEKGVPDDPSSLIDLHMLASDFKQLSQLAVVRAQAAAPSSAQPPPGVVVQVVPPRVIRQDVPRLPPTIATAFRGRATTGVIEFVVTETGDARSPKIIKTIHPLYDVLLLKASRQWKYEPATRNGVAVEFVKRLAMNVTDK